MYKIVFDCDNIKSKVYSGNTFTCNGHRYAEFNSSNPKLYNSKTMAENTAQNLIENCVNTGNNYLIIEE